MPPKQISPAKDWCWTLFAPEGESVGRWFRALQQVDWAAAGVRYVVFQQEAGTAEQHKHLQGFISFVDKKRTPAVQEVLLGNRVHTEKRRGTVQQAADYCKKMETRKPGTEPYEWGELPRGQGARSDLKVFCAKIKESGVHAAALEFPTTFIKYPRGAEALQRHYRNAEVPEERNLTVVVYWGQPGCGKSYAALQYAKGEPRYELQEPGEGKQTWFDGYDGQKILVLNDFEGNMGYRELLRMLDGYKILVQTKGGAAYAEWTAVVITANSPPDQWYPDRDRRGRELDVWCDEIYRGTPAWRPSGLQRRITAIYHGQGVFGVTEVQWHPCSPPGVVTGVDEAATQF